MTHALAVDRPISMLPVLRAADCIPTQASVEPCVLDVGSPRLVARGAVAILLALRHARIGSGAEVLVPAFNCPSMIAPVRAAGAEAVPYPINEDLSIDSKSMQRLITSRTRAVLAAHLYGRINDLAGLKAMCEERGIVLIEDCAHAFFGATAAGPVGSIGHYAVASPRKFFPIAEGGLLTSSVRDLRELALPSASWSQALQSALRMVDSAVEFGHLRALAPVLAVAKRARSILRAKADPQPGSGVQGDDAYDMQLDVRRCVGLAGGVGAGRYLFNVGLIAARRRNFERIAAGINGAAKARVLEMPPVNTFVPYVVPVLLADPQRHFVQLKQLGVPMWRWEHSIRGVCKVADSYSQSLIQLPCHQALRAEEIDRIVHTVVSVCR